MEMQSFNIIKSIIYLSLLVVSVLAQSAAIGYPPEGFSVAPGSSLIVQIERPNSLSASEEVAIVIGLQSCSSATTCGSPADDLGVILYNGPFTPQYHEAVYPPYENFTVQIPSTASSGTALIGVVHVFLVGAGYTPIMETLNRTITIS